MTSPEQRGQPVTNEQITSLQGLILTYTTSSREADYLLGSSLGLEPSPDRLDEATLPPGIRNIFTHLPFAETPTYRLAAEASILPPDDNHPRLRRALSLDVIRSQSLPSDDQQEAWQEEWTVSYTILADGSQKHIEGTVRGALVHGDQTAPLPFPETGPPDTFLPDFREVADMIDFMGTVAGEPLA